MSIESSEWLEHAAIRNAFAAFRYRSYRLWFAGQLVSMLGTWMQATAQGYLVFELTHSAAYLGTVGFAMGIPSWLFMLYGGVVADRVSRRRLMIVTQGSMMALAALLAVLTFSHVVQAWHIVGLSFLVGVANAFDAPARQAFVLEMVERDALNSAIALNSTMFNTATALGPAAAGLIYAIFGPAWCFALNAVSFLAVIAALLAMRPRPVEPAPRGRSAFAELREGMRFVVNAPAVRAIIGLVVASTLFGMFLVPLVPAWAVRILGGDATTNGFLQSARGVGALAGALLVAALGARADRGGLLKGSSLLFPAAILLFAAMRWLPLSLLAMVLVGTGQIVMLNLCNARIQALTPDPLRGRVMAIYSLSFFGFMPVSALLAGAAAELLGETAAIVLSGTTTLLSSALIVTRLPRGSLDAGPRLRLLSSDEGGGT